jgi:hypothetical protein
MSEQDDGFEIAQLFGRGSGGAGNKVVGLHARKFASGRQAIVIGDDVAEKLKVKAGSRLALAQLANGMYAVVQSPCGWKVQQTQGAHSLYFQVQRGIKFLKDAEAHVERGMYVFPAGTFSESRNVDRMFK